MSDILEIPFEDGVELIAQDECGLFAVNKRAGLLSHPNPEGEKKGRSIIKARYNYDEEYFSWENEAGEKERVWLVNRIDSHTSGVLILATNEEVALVAKETFKMREVNKTYYAICFGKLFQNKGIWVDPFKKIKNARNVRADLRTGSSVMAETEFEAMDVNIYENGVSFLKLIPITGRTHQLRIQCAKHRCPIIGDSTYGNFSLNKFFKSRTKLSRLFLHCYSVQMEFEFEEKTISFFAKAPLPESFGEVVELPDNL